jgi:signal transduction histidine kinase
MTLRGSSPERIIKFWFNPSFFQGVYESRQEEVKNLLSDIEGFDPNKVDANLIKGVAKFKKLIEEKDEEVKAAKSAATDLRVEVAEKDQKISQLETEKETYRAQTIFLEHAVSPDVKDLLAYHHQIKLDTDIAENYLAKAIKSFRVIEGSSSVLDYLEKTDMAIRRIAAVAQYATKAGFRSGTKKEPVDIPAFFEQYLLRVAKDFSAADLSLEVVNSVDEVFDVKTSRTELSILIDNIVSNANKAEAHKLTLKISKISVNTIQISFIDDGKGLSKDLPSADSMFEIGVTTTTGSGFGLYHAKRIVDGIGGRISSIPLKPKGMEIRIEVTK